MKMQVDYAYNKVPKWKYRALYSSMWIITLTYIVIKISKSDGLCKREWKSKISNYWISKTMVWNLVITQF